MEEIFGEIKEILEEMANIFNKKRANIWSKNDIGWNKTQGKVERMKGAKVVIGFQKKIKSTERDGPEIMNRNN